MFSVADLVQEGLAEEDIHFGGFPGQTALQGPFSQPTRSLSERPMADRLTRVWLYSGGTVSLNDFSDTDWILAWILANICAGLSPMYVLGSEWLFRICIPSSNLSITSRTCAICTASKSFHRLSSVSAISPLQRGTLLTPLLERAGVYLQQRAYNQ